MRHEGASPDAIYKFTAELSQIRDFAVDDEELVNRNVCKTKAAKVTRPKGREKKSLTETQVSELSKRLCEPDMQTGKAVAVRIALATGMRRGEILGLVWNDIELDNSRAGVIRVRMQLDRKGVRRKPKTSASIRNATIDAATVRYLEKWHTFQKQQLEVLGVSQCADTPVCSNGSGGFLNPDDFSKWCREFFVSCGLGTFEKVETWIDKRGIKRCRKAGYAGFCLHELRHTQASLLIAHGVDVKTVQARLGHADSHMTMDVYAHALEGNDAKAALEIGNLLT